MKYILIPMLFLISFPILADSIKCFSEGKVVYYRNVNNITYTGDLFIFQENKSNRIVMYSGNCIIKLDN